MREWVINKASDPSDVQWRLWRYGARVRGKARVGGCIERRGLRRNLNETEGNKARGGRVERKLLVAANLDVRFKTAAKCAHVERIHPPTIKHIRLDRRALPLEFNDAIAIAFQFVTLFS